MAFLAAGEKAPPGQRVLRNGCFAVRPARADPASMPGILYVVLGKGCKLSELLLLPL